MHESTRRFVYKPACPYSRGIRPATPSVYASPSNPTRLDESTMQQLRHGQHQQISRPCCRGAPSFPGAAAAARPVLALGAAAARSAPPGKLLRRTSACLGQAAAASSGKPRASPARAVAGPATPAGVQVGGKLLLQTFDDAPNSPLRLSIQLVSATVAGSDGRGVKAEASVLDAVVVGSGDTELDVNLVWDEALGAPGAVVVKNLSDFPVYLKLLSAPAGLGADKQAAAAAVHFACNGWVYPVDKHPYRLFFTNDACVKEDTPSALLKYREDELSLLRGDGEPADRPFQPWDRVYDYALYNDLGNPDLRRDLARPVLGGSDEYPYPRRTKTGRPAAKTDPRSETRAALDEEIYVPCDERVGYGSVPAPTLPPPGGHFGSLADIYRLFGLDDLGRLPEAKAIINSSAPFPVAPRVISVNPTNWRKDEEFARQMIAGANPVCIKRVTRFPLTSELDRSVYGDQDSKITRDHVEKNMGGMTVQQAMEEGMLFVVDHHDWVMPYLKRINELPGEEEKAEISQRKVYAARTLLFLNREDSTLKPLAIELSSPHPENEQLGAVSKVYTPPENGDVAAAGRFSAWELAKAHAAANDTVENNFVTHWLNTHATMEPFVIAANRHLSVLHPIHRLLKPHFRKTLHINAVARQIVVGSGDLRKNGSIFRGIHEVTYFPSKYNIEMSSKAYEAWNFTELALPNDLIKRGLARGDPKNPEELELLIKDYPYAVDGLEMWAAIKKWVTDYCAIYYADDGAVARDRELQGWWSEARDVGHGDLRGAPWWPAMSSVADLVEACATVIWLGSAYHAAISFGQYDYQGFVPNGPSLTTGPVPDAAGAEVTEAEFLGSVTPVTEALGFMSIASGPLALTGEVYLGQRPDSEQWTKDRSAAMALAEFRARLKGVAESIERRNADPELKNRTGPVEVPYTLLKPTAQPGPVLRGIPNSITV